MMKIKLGVVSAVLLTFGWLLPAAAADQTTTQTAVSFTAGPTVSTVEDKINQQIPAGQTAYQMATTPADATKATNRHLSGWLGTAQSTGRLPQTDETSTFRFVLLGSMLLIILGLMWGLYRTSRGEAETRALEK